MCGISGILGVESADTIQKMVSIQAHRGPDDSGIEKLSAEPPLYFGNNRLSIIDLSARGHQPMFTEDRSLCLVYNGEIYNFAEIRRELEGRGRAFFSGTDTEVVLKAFECWGFDCFSRLRGMFALAVFDGRRKTVVLARDRIGIKPLYYWQTSHKFAFASEIKALLQIPEVRETLALDRESYVRYLSLLWNPGSNTPFVSIKRLPPGSALELDVASGRAAIKTYWELKTLQHPVSLGEAKKNVFDIFSRAVKSHMIADVKVGAFLSGGLDSSAITAMMAEQTSEPIEAFTIRFSKEDQRWESGFEDYVYSRKLAEQRGFRLHEIEISASAAAELLPKIVFHLDEPIGDPAAINTYLMAKQAKDAGVTILLSGQGGDELFGGYRKYLAGLMLRNYHRFTPMFMRRSAERFLARIPVASGGKGLKPVRWMKRLLLDKPPEPFDAFFSLSSFIGRDKLSALVNPNLPTSRVAEAHRAYYDSVEGGYLTRMGYTDTKLFLPDLNLNYCDKATMAASIECRVPFCDHELVEYASSLPEALKIHRFTQKYVLKKAMEGVLPREIIYRPKMTFGAPLRAWVKTGLKEMIDDYLHPDRIKRQNLLNWEAIRNVIDEDRRGIADHAHLIYGLLTMQVWMDAFGVS